MAATSAAFIAKVDPFGLGSSPLSVVSTTDGKSAQVAEARDENGDVVAYNVFGEQYSPSADYKVVAAGAVSSFNLGKSTSWNSVKAVLTSVTISTSAGGETTVSASGESVPTTAVACPVVYAVPSFTPGVCLHAKDVFSAFTLSGTGCYLNSCTATASAELGRATVNGETVAYGLYNGRIEETVEIIQTGSTVPTLAAATGWVVTSPLTCTNPDADYPTWSATLVKYLEGTTPSSN